MEEDATPPGVFSLAAARGFGGSCFPLPAADTFSVPLQGKVAAAGIFPVRPLAKAVAAAGL